MEEKPELEWCKSNWVQLEIATRQLALHIDFFFEQYYPPVALEAGDSDVVVQLIHVINKLRDYMLQLYWWLRALQNNSSNRSA